MFKTTLNKIRPHNPCITGWTTLLKGLGKTGPDDEELALTRILEINGLDDALWALRALEAADRDQTVSRGLCTAGAAPDDRSQVIGCARRFGEVCQWSSIRR